MNLKSAVQVLKFLVAHGVEEICICPGARNAPFVALLDQSETFRVYPFFEERSASFFALGRIKATEKPVAVCTTSGTAASELLSAAVEGYYTGLPLILVTADRPKHYRGTGSPQTIEQNGIYQRYAPTIADLDLDEEISLYEKILPRGPMHINICFEEPLIDGDPKEWRDELHEWKKNRNSALAHKFEGGGQEKTNMEKETESLSEFLQNCSRPLVITSGLTMRERNAVVRFLSHLKAPIYAESTSGVSALPSLRQYVLSSGEAILKKFDCDGVIRIGGVPTARYWRDLELKLKHIPICNVTSLPFSGITRGVHLQVNLTSFFERLDLEMIPACSPDSFAGLFEEDHFKTKQLKALLDRYPCSEVTLFAKLFDLVRHEELVFVGNSLSIRETDLVAFERLSAPVFSNRGANGIDGQISCFFGAIQRQGAWGIFGDLTTLYDLAAPWALRFIENSKIHLVVMNNYGGKIFSNIFSTSFFQNQHRITFENWAEMWRMSYRRFQEIPASISSEERTLWEIVPNLEQSDSFWQDYKRLWT